MDLLSQIPLFLGSDTGCLSTGFVLLLIYHRKYIIDLSLFSVTLLYHNRRVIPVARDVALIIGLRLISVKCIQQGLTFFPFLQPTDLSVYLS